MGLMLLPHNAPDAAKNVAYLVDEIWYHAGDTSTDVRTWKYTKANKIIKSFCQLFLINLNFCFSYSLQLYTCKNKKAVMALLVIIIKLNVSHSKMWQRVSLKIHAHCRGTGIFIKSMKRYSLGFLQVRYVKGNCWWSGHWPNGNFVPHCHWLQSLNDHHHYNHFRKPHQERKMPINITS